jgi:hypothetical protein
MATARKTDEKVPQKKIEFGSKEHAYLLGLKEASKDDSPQMSGWTLMDITAFGPQATENYIKEVLRQKVSELTSGGPPTPQSADPRKPNYAPPLWVPVDFE